MILQALRESGLRGGGGGGGGGGREKARARETARAREGCEETDRYRKRASESRIVVREASSG